MKSHVQMSNLERHQDTFRIVHMFSWTSFLILLISACGVETTSSRTGQAHQNPISTNQAEDHFALDGDNEMADIAVPEQGAMEINVTQNTAPAEPQIDVTPMPAVDVSTAVCHQPTTACTPPDLSGLVPESNLQNIDQIEAAILTLDDDEIHEILEMIPPVVADTSPDYTYTVGMNLDDPAILAAIEEAAADGLTLVAYTWDGMHADIVTLGICEGETILTEQFGIHPTAWTICATREWYIDSHTQYNHVTEVYDIRAATPIEILDLRAIRDANEAVRWENLPTPLDVLVLNGYPFYNCWTTANSTWCEWTAP